MWTLRWVCVMSTKSPLDKAERAAGGLILAALLLIGCGGKSGETEPIFPVTGRVLVDGEPAKGALVIFHRNETDADSARPRGFALENGTFELTTTSKNDGAPAGSYRVTVLWRNQTDDDEGIEHT